MPSSHDRTRDAADIGAACLSGGVDEPHRIVVPIPCDCDRKEDSVDSDRTVVLRERPDHASKRGVDEVTQSSDAIRKAARSLDVREPELFALEPGECVIGGLGHTEEEILTDLVE